MRISDWSSDVCSSDLAQKLDLGFGAQSIRKCVLDQLHAKPPIAGSNGNGGNALFGPCKVEQAITSITYVGGPAYVEPAAGSAERPIFERIRRELMKGQCQKFCLDGRELGVGSLDGEQRAVLHDDAEQLVAD